MLLWFLSLLLSAHAAAPPLPDVSQPAWLVAPTENADNLLTCSGVSFARSNNNVAIALFKDRLYLAIRSAPHHYPHPPLWASSGPASDQGATKLYVMSTPFGPAQRERVLGRWPEGWKEMRWRLEFEAAHRLDQEQLLPLRSALSNRDQEIRRKALADVERLLGAGVAKTLAPSSTPASWQGYLRDNDLREPHFFVLRGRLHFLFLSIAGIAHRFEVLRAWHTQLSADDTWDQVQPALAPGDHYWDVQVTTTPPQETAYLTVAHGGGHYSFTETAKGRIDLRRSLDGRQWASVSRQGFIDRGRGCEPALGFAPDGRAWMLQRLEDADSRGWGSLLGHAQTTSLDRWTFGRTADPQRFDSARFFTQGRDLYLVARQNLGTDAAGQLLETHNQPYAPGGEAARAGNLGSLALMTRYSLSPKRTALYHLEPSLQQFRLLRTLPSAGDTAFPSFARITPNVFLLANYSSRIEDRNLSWLEGQNRRAGVYLLLLHFPARGSP